MKSLRAFCLRSWTAAFEYKANYRRTIPQDGNIEDSLKTQTFEAKNSKKS